MSYQPKVYRKDGGDTLVVATGGKLVLPADAIQKSYVMQGLAQIATTGNTDNYFIVPETGTLTSADFSSLAALAAHDTNYVTFSITNLGQAGSGNTAMLAATDANTSKITGGTALTANAKRSLTLHATAANLAVTAGDRLLIRVAASGTLAGAVTGPVFCLRFGTNATE